VELSLNTIDAGVEVLFPELFVDPFHLVLGELEVVTDQLQYSHLDFFVRDRRQLDQMEFTVVDELDRPNDAITSAGRVQHARTEQSVNEVAQLERRTFDSREEQRLDLQPQLTV